MITKLGEPSIDPKDPWADDVLDRKEFGQTLISMIESVTQPFVISVKGDWGSGKSVFLRRLRADLEGSKRIPVVNVDAWKSDHYEDPIYALISAVEERLEDHRKTNATAVTKAATISKKMFGSAAKVVEPLVKIAGASADLVTGGAVSTLASGVGELGAALFKANSEKVEAQAQFLQSLKDARDELLGRVEDETPRPIGEKKIVIVIDELDRCRPDYAIKLLERIKHFFEIPGIVFVIAVDGRNLHHAVNTLYGQAIESEVYLRKFFDIEMYLPKPSTKGFNTLLRSSFAVLEDTEFAGANWNQLKLNVFGSRLDHSPDRKLAMIEASAYFEVFAEAYDLKLRDQAQAFARLNACVLALGRYRYFLPYAASFVVCLRYFSHEMYEEWRNRSVIPGFSGSSKGIDVIQPIESVNQVVAKATGIYLSACNATSGDQIAAHWNNSSKTEATTIALGRVPGDLNHAMRVLKASYKNIFAVADMLERDN